MRLLEKTGSAEMQVDEDDVAHWGLAVGMFK